MRYSLGSWPQRAAKCLAGLVLAIWTAGPALAEIDRSRYISPDELRPGMKGFGRTVLSGAKIDTFQVEVVAVMKNAYYAKQDVILVRCSGLNLEHSGIIGGMSGSPCYIVDEVTGGEPRMMGAVAYGWTFNKDPICGVQPITQMLSIPELRAPKPLATRPAHAAEPQASASGGGGMDLGEMVARVWSDPIDEASCFSVLNDDIKRINGGKPRTEPMAGQLQPLSVPVMVSGASERTMSLMRSQLGRFGLEPVASGAASAATREAVGEVKLEPGSALCVPMMRGDMMMEGLGTCTHVDGDRVLGFGHSMFGQGSIELPLATGIVHTVIPSVARSEKLGAALETVGTLYGDENSGIFGVVGKSPPLIPMEVNVTDLRGRRSYHYEVISEERFTPSLLMMAAIESVYAHNEPPQEHTIRYDLAVEFEKLGTFKGSNFTSQRGTGGVAMDLAMPTATLMNAPFGKAKVKRASVNITVEEGSKAASFDEVLLNKMVFKPGQTVEARVRWFHYRRSPAYTNASYSLKLPDDLPDGTYTLTVCSPKTHLMGLRSEKPHLFKADTLPEALAAFNRLAAFPDNGVYLRLDLPSEGVAIDQTEMPELPSFRQKILADSRRTDIQKFSEALAVRHDTEFAVSGGQAFQIKVSRRADQ